MTGRRCALIGLGAMVLRMLMSGAPGRFQDPHTWNSQGT
jgi:hypothetical protein